MGSINKSHNDTDGGVLLFSGELILIFCDSVAIEVGGKESSKGRIYLTTHRIIFVATPMKPNIVVKSVSAPFFALSDIKLEQPVFGANYISARVRDEDVQSQSFTFKLRFSKGGAIEFATAMSKAASTVAQMPPSQPPPPYTATASTQYYQAPPTVYAPGYNCFGGFQMPQSEHFNQPAPIGFIYASSDPPPYQGLTGPQQGPYGQQHPQQQPYGQPSASGPPTHQGGYPPQNPSTQGGTSTGVYPQQQQQGYPGQLPPPSGYPPQQPPPSYNASVQPPQAPAAPPTSNTNNVPSYPTLTSPDPNVAWPSAPSFNPEWKDEDKKTK